VGGGGDDCAQRLPRLVGVNRAREISFTGTPLKAEQAHRWGLVNRLVPQESLLREAELMAARISSFNPEIVAGFKRVLTEGYGMTLAEGRKHERAQGFAHYRAMPQVRLTMPSHTARPRVCRVHDLWKACVICARQFQCHVSMYVRFR
jgi:enoyl-CoA hydratase/carnithine racemase